jgi:hypothetical protein
MVHTGSLEESLEAAFPGGKKVNAGECQSCSFKSEAQILRINDLKRGEEYLEAIIFQNCMITMQKSTDNATKVFMCKRIVWRKARARECRLLKRNP